MKCPNCGATVQPGERFCGECGTDLTAWQAARAQTPPPSAVPPPPSITGPSGPTAPGVAPYQAPPAFTPPPVVPPTVSPYMTPATPVVGPANTNGMRLAGIGLIVAGVVLCALLDLFVIAGSEPPSGDSSTSYQMGYVFGQLICGAVPLLLFGGIGVVLLMRSRSG